MSVDQAGNLVIIGLTLGAVYAIMALGLSFIYGITKIFNYAHGAFYTWGAYIAWILYSSPLPRRGRSYRDHHVLFRSWLRKSPDVPPAPLPRVGDNGDYRYFGLGFVFRQPSH